MTTDIIKHEQLNDLNDLLYDHATQLDFDSDYWFRLRGYSINPIIDAVTPLLGMVLRIRQLSSHDQVAELYQRVVTEIQAIEQELIAHGYENGMVLSFRYILCTFIDEAVMSQEWGSLSEWSEHSLLTRFHNETWGGEKVFVLLNKLQEDPARYREVLEFIYLCLCLGFEGRYRVMNHGREEFERVVRQLHHQLSVDCDDSPIVFHLNLGQQISSSPLKPEISLRSLCIGTVITLLGIFIFYYSRLDNQTQDVLRQLNELLK
ncbi:MAG: type IVB secretion system protein IcmH/DotU [Plesiomonas sp.]